MSQWFYDLWDYWQSVIEEQGGRAFSGHGKAQSKLLLTDTSIKGALSKEDFVIFSDAMELECEAILTCDKYRNRQDWILRKYKLMVLYPTDFLAIINEFRALWNG